MLATRYKSLLDRLLEPLAAAIARTGVSPSAITLVGPALTLAVCLWFVQTAAILPFCLLMALVGGLDVLDGAVARASGRVTKFGAYLDAVCDRYVDAMVVGAAAVVTGYWTLSLITLAGTLLVSYAKARAAMEVPISNLEWPDLMERAERSTLFLGGLAASVLLPWQPLGRDLFWWTLLLLAILTHLTVAQRILRARRFISSR
ncbi:MAG: CDP-alcohol phosphatidyltransferase family protein [Candidatus Omnitrophica bacterium]|nr:CDP-alcohol phosphatidyltransferase family protein [Candidatus Omnitrophota bacterium]